MKPILLFLLVCLWHTTNATTYYFSSSTGDDNRTSTQAQNPGTPWKTIAKLNSFFSSLQPGDVVLFNRGEMFYGSIAAIKSGTTSQPIIISAYGSGNRPVILGTVTLTNWTSVGNGIWECTSSSLGSVVNTVLLNNAPQEMGRYPNSNTANKGYLNYESHNGNTSITDNQLGSSPNWTGAEVVIRKCPWILDRHTITGHSGSTLTYSGGGYTATNNFGYFIQNDFRTLDMFGEWYYNPSLKKISMHFGSDNPSNYDVKVSGVDNLVYMNSINNVVFDNLSFRGANLFGLRLNATDRVSVKNCDIIASGDCGVKASFTSNLLIENCFISNSYNNGIDLEYNNDNSIIRGNKVENTSLFTGMGKNGDGSGTGINVRGQSNLIEYNEVINTGYIGISFYEDASVLIKNNYVNNFSLTKSDGGGIYTNGTNNYSTGGRRFTGNIVLNGIGAGEGTSDPSYLIAEGIYLDDRAQGVEVSGNTVANVPHFGLLFNNAKYITAKNNTFFNNGSQLQMFFTNTTADGANNEVLDNIFFAKKSTQKTISLTTTNDDIVQFASSDRNYFARPLDDKLVIQTTKYYTKSNEVNEALDLETWRATYNKDGASKRTPVQIPAYQINQLIGSNKLVYNDGTFSTSTYGVGIWTASNNGVVSWDNSGVMDGGSVKVSFSPNLGTAVSLITINVGAISSSKKYILKYSLKGSNDNGISIGAYLRKTGDPYNDLSSRFYAQIRSTRTENEVLFTFPQSESDAVLCFIVNDQNLQYWLDNIKFYEADVSETNPDNYIRFEYNASQSSKTVSLDGSYIDVKGNTYSNTVTLQPYTSVVLIKQSGPIANVAPVANAGNDITITLPVNSASLSGSGTDADGSIASYLWTKISGPSNGSISNANSATTNITSLVQGVYQFELKVTDNSGATATDIVQVTVNPAANVAPVANAGNDITITLPVNSASLSGSGSDADGSIASYLWTKISGPSNGSISNANNASTSLTSLVQGVYQFELKVTDNSGATATDVIQVTVNAAANVAPVANAGNDITITLPVNSASLSGSGSDADGSIASYLWTKISGPSNGSISNANNASTSLTSLVQGVYQFELKVTDNSGATATDVIQVTVNAAANVAPVANAGNDITITLPVNSASLSGSGSDADGSIASYLWTKISGPSNGSISNANSATTNITSLVQGVYQFELKVTDNSGATATDIVQVTVNAAANVAPVANAGNDITITLPVNSASLSGSGSDADGSIASYLWTKISGPSNGSISNANNASTSLTSPGAGVYQFELKVTDNSGATATDVIQVTVNAAANVAPVANAGNDITITLPVNSASLSGSGSDADGSIASYLWTKISGPSNGSISNANNASTSLTSLVQGVYQFELKVTDNSGATATDVIQVTVNAAANVAPVANAGNDITITLPVNSASLSGSGSDADGSIISYEWTKISGPANGSISNANNASTSLTSLVQGVYQFELKVTDNSGATATDVIQVTVNAAVNVAPVANAGNDITITLPVNSASLSGSGSDADGSIASYLWTKISGPANGSISNANNASTSLTSLVQGVYQFELKVTDNSGATATDVIQVTVNAAANVAPVANAGNDITITLPVNSASLSGSGTDADGSIVYYEWTKISGPSSGTITNANNATTTVTSLVQGVYQFELKVTDNSGATATDVIQVTVNAAANVAPVANAGNDITITLPVNSASLSGSGTDADGSIVSYEWTKISGPSSGTITNANNATTTVTSLVQGVYQFELKVTDNSGATATDIIQVTVNAAANVAPVANAGNDITITLPVNSASLSGSGTDADGSITSYEWRKISGPGNGSISNANSATTSITSLVQGIYQFELKVTDNSGATATDIVQVIVNPAGNIAPIVNAGNDITIILPVNSASFSGSGSDADGSIVSYEWSKISGPSSGTITNANSTATSVTSLVQGVYQFELKVTDNSGATATDVIQVTVNAAANVAPVANAGNDITITLPVNSASLSGSGSDADGSIASYLWTKISGPANGNISNANNATSNITSLVQGVYQFELKVTDNSGATATDVVQVTVNAAANVAPVANAGNDITITLPANSASLSGSGSDADGSIASYEWTKISGPSNGSISNANNATTNVTSLVQGVYQFELKVTDNSGATSTDIVQVTVNAAANVAPVANAGNDITITLPVNSVSLSGSGSDADGSIASYEWTKISGPSSGTITNANSTATTVTSLEQGVYQFELKVTDNSGANSTDIVQVTVNAAANVAPVANAGNDITITLPVNSASLSGSGSDADGSIVSYKWKKISGPANANISNSNSAATTITSLVQGVYQFELKVTDNSGSTATDIVQVTVNPAANVAPVANAGNDITITLPVNSASLSGSGSDADGSIASYEWTKISGPANGSISNANNAATTLTLLVQGVYQFELKVKDNSGATATDIVQVTVNAAANVAPVANAGNDITITLPVNSASLSGSGTDADGTISSYEWTKISGPGGMITDTNSPITSVISLVQGVYHFQLKVTDNEGTIATDIVQVIVNPADNIAPVANAGNDITITLPVNSASLSGSGSDADGSIASYEWTKISGPANGDISNGNNAATSVTSLVKGVYQFELKVTDNNGAIATDIIQVTVNAAANVAPVADAGNDITITLPVNSVLLSGSGTDADGTIASYEWTKISGPANGDISNAHNAATSVTSLVQGVYEFELKVTDNTGATATDIIQVTVNPAANVAPVANAGNDITITLPVNSVSLSGSGSDADGSIVSYEWSKISGPSSGTITNANSTATTVTSLVQGVYEFELRVTDNSGSTATDIVQVTVNAAANVAPVANAGNDITITLPVNSASLSGSGSDLDGTVVSYVWTKISGPAGTITNTNSPISSVTSLVQGVYQFELKITDNSGSTATDIVQVTVNAAAIVAPVANAGNDITITLPVNSASLSGSGSDADGSIASYEWTKISGPTDGMITNVNSPITSLTSLVQGVYQFELKITDNSGATATDIVQVTVNAAANVAPVANAGNDITITLPVNSASLSGSGSDADGSIASYEWTKISGPSNGTIGNANNATTNITSLVQGVYQFELKVTDNSGATATDIVQVTVNAAANVAPVANAGNDITITLPVNSASLSGSGSDADGSIVSYEWTKISGPANGTISNTNSATTSLTSLVLGVYQFELKVTDNSGATSTDIVQVTVNAAANVAPVANAGNDITITLPVNSASLSGSGTDADGSIASYEWTKISGPSNGTIGNANNAATTITSLVQGVYQFELKVTDNSGATATDIVQVTVNAAANVAPVANAGNDITITLPVNSASLSGSGTDADGSIISYQWTKISGPANGNISNANNATTNITSLVQGVYQFELKVTDNSGATATDIVQVTVNARVNIAPVANAGNDTTVIAPINSLIINGNATDADGRVVSYLWSQISGPSNAVILPKNKPVTNISNLIGGTYEFELKATDNGGMEDRDTVIVIVDLGRFAPEVNNITVYPNPVHDIATLEIKSAERGADLVINISDLTGKIIYTKTVKPVQNTWIEKLNMSGVAKGIYPVTVYFNGKVKQTLKVVKL